MYKKVRKTNEAAKTILDFTVVLSMLLAFYFHTSIPFVFVVFTYIHSFFSPFCTYIFYLRFLHLTF